MVESNVLNLGSGKSIVWAIFLIIFGFLAIALPFATSLGVVLILGWLLIFSGGLQLLYAFHSKGVGSVLWKLLVSALYFVVGLSLLLHPMSGVAGITLVLAVFFVAEGIVDLIAYFQTRSISGSGWILFDGIVTLILGVLVWKQWPSSSLWVIGTLVGIDMMITGWTRLMISLAARRLQRAL
ncbi:MAG TPA: DUF308 domain-containing protein [Acidisarcina sp.]|nr:DUF308 domain-containing protein [Acidisarcina sp.]